MTEAGQTRTNIRTRQVLAFSGTFLPGYKAGGPIKSMVNILDSLPDSVKVTLVTSDRDLGDSAPYYGLSGQLVHRGTHDIYYMNWHNPRHWLNLMRLGRRAPADLIYVNSLWSPQFTVLPVIAHRLGLLPARELLLAPRGELTAGALGIKSAKKKAFLLVWAPLLRRVNPVWHASTEMEAADIHRLFPGARTVIQTAGGNDQSRTRIVRCGERARFVFISRIAEMKNLLLALQALQMVTAEVDFDIYGPVEDVNYWEKCQRLIAKLPGNVRVRYLGELRPSQVKETFAQHDAFILPTRGENFGHVIAESLSSGCPVICSRHTPWTQVLLQGGGAAVATLDPGAFSEEIGAWANRTALQRDTAKRDALSAYSTWSSLQEKKSAVESALDALPKNGQHEGDPNSPRIALVTQGYQSAGGVQTVSRWMAAGLGNAGYTVDVFDLASSRADPHSRRLMSPGTWGRSTLMGADPSDVHVTHVGANGVEFEPLRYLPRSELTAELNRYDLVQVVAGGPSLALAASKCQRPIVLQVATTVAWERESQRSTTSPGLALWRGAMTRATSLMERAALRRADAVLVENSRMRDFVHSVGQTQVIMAPPGVDTERFAPRADGWDSSGYLLSVCRLSDSRKGLDRLIRAYALMRSRRPSVPRLVLAGRGGLPPHLKQLITELDLADCVSVRSDVPQDDLPSLYTAASVYLQTSHEEGLGISVLEAMACGLPVVSTETAGTLETIAHGETGWLVSQGSEVESAIAERTLSIWDDDAQAMSHRARSRAVSLFSDHATLSRFLAIYDQFLDGGPGTTDELCWPALRGP